MNERMNQPTKQPTNLFLTLIQPASKWMHWATLRRHSDLFWAVTSTSSQVIPILNKSLLTVLLQFVCGRPGPLLNPGTSQCNNACRGMRWWSIRITCPSQRSLLSLSMSSILCCPVLTLTSSFVMASLSLAVTVSATSAVTEAPVTSQCASGVKLISYRNYTALRPLFRKMQAINFKKQTLFNDVWSEH